MSAVLAALLASQGAAPCAWQRGEVLELTGDVVSGGLTGRLVRRIETDYFFPADAVAIVFAAPSLTPSSW